MGGAYEPDECKRRKFILCYTLAMRRLHRYANIALAALVGVSLLSGCDAGGVETSITPTDNGTLAAPAPRHWPHINRFTASVENITAGDNVTLEWDVTDAQVVSIDSGVGKVRPQGVAVVSPQKTTKYTLTAAGEKGVSTAWVTVIVPEKILVMPDLTVTGITYISGLLYYTVKNTGNADAGPCDTYLWDQSNMWRDTSWVDGLKAGEEKTKPFTNFSYHGNKITVCADGGKVITESNEDNNCFVPTFGFKFNYSLAQNASRATWRGSAGRFEFGTEGDSSLGRVTKLNVAVAEDGASYNNVIVTVPPPDAFGWVEGLFGEWQGGWQTAGYMLPIELPNNARFTAKVGLTKEAEGSGGVTFVFGLMSASGAMEWWPGVKATYDGQLDSLDIDLSSFAGKKVMPVLKVEAGADPDRNIAAWIDPRIVQ